MLSRAYLQKRLGIMKSGQQKRYFWQVCKYWQRDSVLYKEMQQSQTCDLFVYKEGHPNIVVKLINPTEKIHCWMCHNVEILQKMNDNPLISHWKRVSIPFKGELIPTLLDNFNQKLKEEIDLVPRKTQALERWIQAKIGDVFIIKERKQISFGCQHSFIQISMLIRARLVNHYQVRKWRSQKWQGLLQIAQSEGITQNKTLSSLMDEVYELVMSFQVVRDTKYSNMFDIHLQKKSQKKQSSKDDFQKQYQRKIMIKYHLYEYLEDQ